MNTQSPRLIHIFSRHKWVGIFVCLLVIGTACLALFFIPKTYEIESDIFIEPRGLDAGGNALGFSGYDFRILNNQIEIIKSDRVAATASRLFNEYLKTGKCDACKQAYPEIALTPLHSPGAFPVGSNYKQWFQDNLNVDKKENTSVLDARFSAEGDPADLTTIFNIYLAAYKLELGYINSDKARSEYNFVLEQFNASKKEWEQFADQIQQFKNKNQSSYDISTFVSQKMMQSNRMDDQVKNLDADIAGAQNEIAASEKQLPASADYINYLSRLEKDPEIANYRNQLVSMEASVTEWSSKLTDDHPKMISYNDQIKRMKSLLQNRIAKFARAYHLPASKRNDAAGMTSASTMEDNLATEIINQKIKLQSLLAKRNVLAGEIHEIDASLSDIPQQEREYAQLKAHYDLAQEKMTNLQKKLDDALVMKEISATLTKVDILKKPEVPEKPIKPDILKISVAAVLMGLFLGLLSIYLRTTMDRTLHWPVQLKGALDTAEPERVENCEIFNLPPLPGKDNFRKLLEKSNFYVPEQYKRVIIHLENLGKKHQIRRLGIIPVTPSVQGNMTIVSLGLYLTELSNKMVLIDTDYSKHSVTKLVSSLNVPVSAGIQQGPGLSHYLRGEVDDFVDVIYPLGKTIYGSFIPAGQHTEENGFAFSQKNLVQLENNLSPNYDFVVYSLSSVIESYDSLAVGRTLDGVILVAHPEVSSLNDYEKTIRELNSVGANILAVLYQPLG